MISVSCYKRMIIKEATYLVGHGYWDIGVGTCGSKEDTKVSHTTVTGETKDSQTNNGEDGVESARRSAYVEAVAKPAGPVHHKAGESVGRSNQAL